MENILSKKKATKKKEIKEKIVKKNGRPFHVPTDENRKNVETLYGYGLTQEEVAAFLKISIDTLFKYYQPELDIGFAKTKGFVLNKLFGNIKEGKEASIFFWLKTRAGFKETNSVEHSGLMIEVNVSKKE